MNITIRKEDLAIIYEALEYRVNKFNSDAKRAYGDKVTSGEKRKMILRKKESIEDVMQFLYEEYHDLF